MPYVIITLAVTLVLGGVYVADAQETASSTRAETNNRQTTLREQRGEGKAQLTALAQGRLTNLAANVSNRFDAAVRRIENVTGRLESRMNKMAAEGTDVSVARAKLVEAKTALDTAQASLAAIDTEVAIFVGSENPRERWKNLREIYTRAGNDIKAAHKATAETLLLLRSATNKAPEASDISSSTAPTI